MQLQIQGHYLYIVYYPLQEIIFEDVEGIGTSEIVVKFSEVWSSQWTTTRKRKSLNTFLPDLGKLRLHCPFQICTLFKGDRTFKRYFYQRQPHCYAK